MNDLIRDPNVFFEQLRKESGVPHVDIANRACIIVRSPANFGREGTVIIEWEGSPPRYTVIYVSGGTPFVYGRYVHWRRSGATQNLIRRFLEAHPANEDGSPVWVGIPWKDRP